MQENAFLELCLHRQSCRDFSDRPVKQETLMKCVEAARLAPSGCNGQPWSFVVVETPETVSEVSACAQQMGMNSYIANASAFIVILEEHAVLMPALRKIIDSQYFAKGDLGIATAHICLMAESLSLGTCVVGIYDREKICELLHIPIEKQFGALIAVGYPHDNTVRLKNRKNLNDIVRFV